MTKKRANISNLQPEGEGPEDNLSKGFHFCTVVWGEEFIDRFLNTSIPCQLASGNLPAISSTSTAANKYHIYTTTKNAETIEHSSIYTPLSEIIEVEMHLIDDILDAIKSGDINKYDAMTICHGRAIEQVVTEKGVFVCLMPDSVFPDGAFERMRKIIMTGKRAVVIGSFRVIRESFVPELLKHYYSLNERTITVSPRELVALSLKHIHPHSKHHFWDLEIFDNNWPAYLYWHVGKRGVLQRGIHLMPLATIPTKDALVFDKGGVGIDGTDYLSRICPNFDDIYLVQDSDEIYFLDISDSYPENLPIRKPSVLSVAAWIKRHASPDQIYHLKKKIRFHADDLSSEWEKVETHSDRIVDLIFTCLDFFDRVPESLQGIDAQNENHQSQLNFLLKQLNILRQEDATAHIRLGIALMNQNKVEEAVTAFHRSISLIPNDPFPYNQLGIALYKLKRYATAKGAFQVALKLSPTNLDALVNLAEVHRAQRQYTDAIRCLKQAMLLAPRDLEVLTTLATLALKISDSDAAHLVLKHLKMIEPAHPLVQRLGQAFNFDYLMTHEGIDQSSGVGTFQ
ncbi:MAG: tetratricopeptide repeat protein [bacterium]